MRLRVAWRSATGMRILIAPDKFKGSLSAAQAARAMSDGVLMALPDATVDACPMADGGEGTVEAVVSATGAEVHSTAVSGPLPGQRVTAAWALTDGSGFAGAGRGEAFGLDLNRPVAVIEMAQASGLVLIPEGLRDPMVTSTRGTGELITAALDAGCRQVVVGIGGSGTVDGGMGMAAALGYRFFDGSGALLETCGRSLAKIARVDAGGRDPRIDLAKFVAASDVDNPLVGPEGAARVYGPQKGAGPEDVEELERGMLRFAEALRKDLGIDVLEAQGAGAAGGLGAGLIAFCGANVVSGVEVVAGFTSLRERIAASELVLTGEGSYDSQTQRGKTPAGVAGMAKDLGVPAVVLAARLAGDAALKGEGGPAPFCILPGPMPEGEAVGKAEELLRFGTARLMRLITLSGGGL